MTDSLTRVHGWVDAEEADTIIANLQAQVSILESQSTHKDTELLLAESGIAELQAQVAALKEVGWCVLGSIQDKDDREYLRAALEENE